MTPLKPLQVAYFILVVASGGGSAFGQTASRPAEAELVGIRTDLQSAIASFDHPPEIAPGFPVTLTLAQLGIGATRPVVARFSVQEFPHNGSANRPPTPNVVPVAGVNEVRF